MEGLAQLNQKAKSAAYWLLGSNLLINLLTWLVTIMVARILTPEDYGLFGLTTVVTSLFMMLNEIGLGAAIIQKKDLTEADLNGSFWLLIGINFLLYAVVFFSAPFLGQFFEEEGIVILIRSVGICLVLGGLYKIPYALLTKEMRFKERTFADIVAKIIGSLVTIVSALAGFGVWSLVFGYISQDSARLICLFYFSGWLPNRMGDFKKAGQMMFFGSNVLMTSLLWYIYSNSDYLIAGKMMGKEMLGYYTFAFQLASLPLERLVAYIGQIIFPYFSKLQDQTELLKAKYLQGIRFTLLISAPVFIGICLVADNAVILFLTEKWAPMIIPFQLLATIGILRTLAIFNNNLALAKGEAVLVMTNALLMTMIMPVCFYIGVKNGGIVGLALVWVIVFPFLFVVTTWRIIRIIDLSFFEYLKNVKTALITTLIMAGAVLIVKSMTSNMHFPAVEMAVHVTVGVIVYVAVLNFVFRRDFNEIKGFFKK